MLRLIKSAFLIMLMMTIKDYKDISNKIINDSLLQMFMIITNTISMFII